MKIQRSRPLGRLLVAVFALIALAFGAVTPAQAQFSENWEFIKALEDEDYREMRGRLFAGASVNAKNPDGFPALVIAAEKSNLTLLTFLLDQGANVNVASAKRKATALMIAAGNGFDAGVILLIERGVDVNLEDRGGETALIKAARNRRRGATKALLGADADVDHQDYTGKTALSHAQDVRARSVTRLLEDAGAKF